MTTVGIVSPGSMGAAVGACLVGAGTPTLWAAQGRGPATQERAEDAGMTDVGDLDVLVQRADVILSVCPPHAAQATAERIAALGFVGTYVDANAVAPSTARRIAAVIRGTARFVDGGIVGPPPRAPGRTRLYLAGASAASVATLFDGTALAAVPLDAAVPAASALKVAYAAWTKGTAALLLTTRSFAAASGVEHALLDEWAISQPDLPERSERTASSVAPKAWRWVGEMEEIAEAFAAHGLPPGFHQAAADVYDRLATYQGSDGASFAQLCDDLLNDAVSDDRERPSS